MPKYPGFRTAIGVISLFLLGSTIIAFAANGDAAQIPASDPLHLALDAENAGWAADFNAKAGEVGKYYLDKAVLFAEGDCPIIGQADVAKHYRDGFNALSPIESIQAEARYLENPRLVYEIGHFDTGRREEYQYLLIWAHDGGSWRRELEVTAKKAADGGDAEGIDRARRRWAELCKTHDPKALVQTMYTADACYCNRGRVIQGRPAIALEYGYMADPSYSLDLTPGSLAFAAPDLAFEIGQCSGSYGGHYILRWRKEPDGEWRISLDSNY